MNPFTKVSLTGTSLAVFIISNILHYLGVEFDIQLLEGAVVGFVALASFIGIIIGQFRRTDLVWGIKRK